MLTRSSPTPGHSAEQMRANQTAERDVAIWSDTTIRSVVDAILHTVVYADLFDYPLTTRQIHYYLTGYAAPFVTVEECLAHEPWLRERLGSSSHFWFLEGREHLVSLRQEREAFSQALWPAAWRYGHLVSALPFVRMSAVTGSLTMNNVASARDDIDLLIVTQTGRVWLARAFVILVVHLAARQGIELCPNYVMAEDHLKLGESNLFTAHELAQLVPLYGFNTYRRLLESNAWLTDYLPNASLRQRAGRQVGAAAQSGQRLLEAVLGGRLADAVERWERERKIPRLYQIAAERGGTSARYTPNLCKGHVDDHGPTVYQRYAARLAAQGISAAKG